MLDTYRTIQSGYFNYFATFSENAFYKRSFQTHKKSPQTNKLIIDNLIIT